MRRDSSGLILCLVLALMVVFGVHRARGADAVVYIRSSGFTPASVSINVGETVYFIVADDNGPYCVQSTIGAWTPWYLWEEGEGFGIQINERGDYYYRDAFDSSRTGVIHVGTGVPNVPPSLTITSPQDGAVLTEPASFTFAATVTDADNGVTAVEFYVGGNLVDMLYTGPFSTQVTDLAAGYYTLMVVARDAASASTSASINIWVQSSNQPTITLTSPRLLEDQLLFEATGLIVGKTAVLEATSSLGSSVNWIPLETNIVTAETLSFSTPVLPGGWFFRISLH